MCSSTAPTTARVDLHSAEQQCNQHSTEEPHRLRLHTIVTIALEEEDDSEVEPISVDDVPAAEEESQARRVSQYLRRGQRTAPASSVRRSLFPSGPRLPVHHAVSQMYQCYCNVTPHLHSRSHLIASSHSTPRLDCPVPGDTTTG
jgi:hypothetical protein